MPLSAGGWRSQSMGGPPSHVLAPRSPYDWYGPAAPSLSTVGHVRVLIGGVAEPLEGPFEVYVLVGLDSQPTTPSRPLPHEHSALMPKHEWQTYTFELDPRLAAASNLRFELMCWRPNVGEHSLGRMGVDLERILQNGRLEMTAPMGVAIEVDWLPPIGRGEADVLVGSRVRLAAADDDENLRELRRSRVWAQGYEPTPSLPISVCGLPPSTPPRPGHVWKWGHNTWHEIRIDY